MPKYLSPRNDYSFKTLFRKDHKKLTLSFLNAILGKTEGNLIQEITFHETEQIPELRGDRRSFLDLYCIDEKGKHFIVEMQNDPQDFFFDRMVYYASLIFSRQRPRPFLYEELTPVICIGILSTKLNDDHPDVISEHAIMNTKHNTISSRHMLYYLVELGKFNKTEDELETDTDKWLFFMKNADLYKSIPAVLQNDDNFKKAFDVLEHIALSEKELFAYLAAADAHAQIEGIKSFAVREAVQQKAQKIALKMLAQHKSIEEIVDFTELTVEEIEHLKQQK